MIFDFLFVSMSALLLFIIVTVISSQMIQVLFAGVFLMTFLLRLFDILTIESLAGLICPQFIFQKM